MAADRTGQTDGTFYPINIKLRGKRVCVFGGTAQALAELARLVQFGANVDVVSPHMVAELQDAAVAYGDRISLIRRKPNDDDLKKIKNKEYALIFACFNAAEENEPIIRAAKEAGVLVSAANDAGQSDYVVPSLIKRGHLKITVSTDNISQALERAVVQRIEAIFVSEIDSYTLFLTSMRELMERIKSDKVLSDPATFREVVRSLADSEGILHALQRRNFDEANLLAQTIVDQLRANPDEQVAF
jgi:precorrin-2 dehydrogenase/sirohydrochlorin ferrochelatase